MLENKQQMCVEVHVYEFPSRWITLFDRDATQRCSIALYELIVHSLKPHQTISNIIDTCVK